MSNYKIISSQASPLYVEATSIINTAVLNGKVFSVTTGDQTIPSSGFLAIQLTIPANSDTTFYLLRIAGGSAYTAVIDTYRNASFSSGTSMTPYPQNWAYSGGSSTVCKYMVDITDPTSGGENISTIVANGLVIVSYDGRVVIPSSTSDQNFYVVLKNKTNQSNVAAATVVFMESP